MKNKVIVTLSILICLASSLSACSLISKQEPSAPQSTGSLETTAENKDEKIKELEAKIISILQSQQLSETERKKEIALLKAEIDALRKSESEGVSSEKESASTGSNESEHETKDQFSYVLNGYSATITSVNFADDTLIIPSVIDGHAVKKLGQEILPKNSSVKRIIISSGVESIDWFAFKGCSSLSTITIPSSVTSIGYGVFDGAPKSIIIECTKDSFAMKYAQSYGIKYNAN